MEVTEVQGLVVTNLHTQHQATDFLFHMNKIKTATLKSLPQMVKAEEAEELSVEEALAEEEVTEPEVREVGLRAATVVTEQTM